MPPGFWQRMTNETTTKIVEQAANLPAADSIRRTAVEVVGRPEFQLGAEFRPRAKFFEWLVDFLDRVLSPLVDMFRGLWNMSPVLATLVVVLLVVVLIALVAHMAWSFQQALRTRRSNLQLSSLGPRTLDPRAFEIESEEAAHRQDYIRAIRLLFRATLLRLEQRDKRGFRPGMTNRECLFRYRNTGAFDVLRMFVDTIDAKWYGYGVCDVRDYMRCQQAHAQLHALLGGTAHADRP